MSEIWDISKIPLPFTEMIGSDTIGNASPTWTTDELQDPDIDNAVVDGSDAGADQSELGLRVGNKAQISTKVVRVSTRAIDSDTIGRSNELSYQVMMRQRELRRDVEAIMLTNQASLADDGASVAGRSAGLGAWLTTNAFRGATGTDGGFNTSTGLVDAPTLGTPRALSETLVRDVAQSVWEQGGNPTTLMGVPTVIRLLSEYMFTSTAKIANLTSDVREKTSAAVATGSVNLFITDFGVTLMMIPNRLQQNSDTDVSDLFCIDPAFIRQGFLTGYRVDPVAKTGLADNRQMHVDWTLKVLNEKAQGVIADIDNTAAVIA